MAVIPLAVRQARLERYCHEVQSCRICPAMNDGQARVLSSTNGRAGARVMFIAEAPGRKGADRTCVPIHGDATGDNFEWLLSEIKWQRGDVFVTNAVLCNPRDSSGNNRPPTGDELANCSRHLGRQIELVRPLVIATLGNNALNAIGLIEPHSVPSLRSGVARCFRWSGRWLFPLYHPSPRATLHRDLMRQRDDWAMLRDFVESLLCQSE